MGFYNDRMANKVYLNPENIIVIEVVGDQDVASVEAMGRQADALLTELKGVGKRGLVLDDLTQMGKVGSDARKVVVELSKTLDYDRLAMLGKGGGAMKLGTNLMLRASGRAYKLRYFDDRQAAVDWLHEKAI